MAIHRASPSSCHRTALRITTCFISAAVATSLAAESTTVSPFIKSHSEQGLMPVYPRVQDPGFIVERLDVAPTTILPMLCPGCAALSAVGPFGLQMTYIADPDGGVVTRLSPEGAHEANFVIGLARPTAVALPTSGCFAGCMFVNDAGCVWAICPVRRGDLDGDGQVGVADLRLLLIAWGSCQEGAEPCTADFDCDQHVGGMDLAALLDGWG
jgi:hypothetical protein